MKPRRLGLVAVIGLMTALGCSGRPNVASPPSVAVATGVDGPEAGWVEKCKRHSRPFDRMECWSALRRTVGEKSTGPTKKTVRGKSK